MADATDVHGVVFKNGSATCMARLVGASGTAVVPVDVASVTYSIYLLNDQDPDSLTSVADHENVTISVEEVFFDSLQNDQFWDVDSTGYNFKHVIDVSSHPAFSVAGRHYLIEYRITPLNGQVALLRFRAHCL